MRVARCDVFFFVFALIFGITGCQSKQQTIVYPDSEPSPVVEPEYEIGVIRNVANLREGPSMQFSIITKLNPGTTVRIIEKQGNWYRILTAEEVEAYVHSSLVKLGAPSPAPVPHETPQPVTTPQTVFDPERNFIVKQGSNMRSGPGKEYDPPSAFIKAGAEFIASGRTGNWYLGSAQGKTGWIHNSLLSEEGSMREVPTGSGAQPPDAVNEPQQQPEQTGVTYQPPVAEPASDPVIEPSGSPGDVRTPVAAGTGKVVSASPVKIRVQPSAFGRVTGEAAPGQTVQIVGCEGSWCEIKTSKTSGYVQSVNLSQEGN